MTSYDMFVMNNPDTYSGGKQASATTAVALGIGDSTYERADRSSMGEDSYDAWVRGNPDQESGF